MTAMKRMLGLLGAIAFGYFAVTVPIGKRTLWGHVVRIAKTPEAKELADGAKELTTDVARKAKQELDSPSERPKATTSAPKAE
jgi:hypothetical protein